MFLAGARRNTLNFSSERTYETHHSVDLLDLLAGATLTSPAQALAQGNYKNFRVAMSVFGVT